MTLTIGSMFSGMGGLDLAVEAVTGAKPAWFCEWDDAPSKVLAHHWPTVPNYRDVTQIDWESVPRVDILTGGSPCQDLSHAGKRAGMTEGTRSNLWVNMREAIATLNPFLVVWENVLGALSATATSDSDMEPGQGLLGDGGGGHLRALGRVLGDLAEIGYDATWTTIRASDVGAPHHRARVFLIAWPSAADTEGSRWDHGTSAHIGAANREKHAPGHDSDPAADAGCAAVWEQPGGSSAEEAGPEAGDGSVDPGGKRPAGNGRGACAPDPQGGGGVTVDDGTRSGASCVEGDGRTDGSYRSEVTPHPSGIGCERAGTSRAGRARPADGHNRTVEWGDYAPAVRRWERLTRPAPDPTEPNAKGKPRLNAAFAEWMMGLPEGHVTGVPGLSRADQLKMIGNGVCPQQGAMALRELIGIMEETY